MKRYRRKSSFDAAASDEMLENETDLRSLSLDQLWSLHEEVSAVLSARIVEEKRKLEKRLAILAHGADFTDAPTGFGSTANSKPRRRYPEVLPKYRNPDTSETWSGRGKRPRWLMIAMELGRSPDEFLIANEVSPKIAGVSPMRPPVGRKS